MLLMWRLTYRIFQTYMDYAPKNFSDLFGRWPGAELWEYLQRPRSVLVMETATKLHRPAVEAVGEELLGEFGELVRGKRMKQMIGHMVRQVMEARGYELDAQRVPVRFDTVFSTGSRYRRGSREAEAPEVRREMRHDIQPGEPAGARIGGDEPSLPEAEQPGRAWAAWE
jgi:hypothetical protein